MPEFVGTPWSRSYSAAIHAFELELMSALDRWVVDEGYVDDEDLKNKGWSEPVSTVVTAWDVAGLVPEPSLEPEVCGGASWWRAFPLIRDAAGQLWAPCSRFSRSRDDPPSQLAGLGRALVIEAATAVFYGGGRLNLPLLRLKVKGTPRTPVSVAPRAVPPPPTSTEPSSTKVVSLSAYI